MSLLGVFVQYTREPTETGYLSLRSMVAAAPGFSRYANYQETCSSLIAEGAYQEAVYVLLQELPRGLLSPSLHLMLSYCYDKLGQAEPARSEAAIYDLTLRSIAATGDGSAERPYLVLQIGDEYDLLHALGKTPSGQRLMMHDGKMLDVQTLDDGSEVWFDVSTPQPAVA